MKSSLNSAPISDFNECSICLFDTSNLGISISDSGICNICITVENLRNEYGSGVEKGRHSLEQIVKEIRESGAKEKYDCIIGVSGGTDSSYLLIFAKEMGLRPLAVHYDNTWNSSIATTNIARMLQCLEIDLYTYVINNKEADDIFRSAFLAGVAELDASTDLAFAYLLRKVARQQKVRFILEGHSFMEEGITPLGRNYFDGAYIRDIHRQFGRLRMKSYPLMTILRFLRETIFGNVQFIRPLWYIDYQKARAKDQLKSFGWRDYGGHHLENMLSTFMHSEYLPKKFNTDMRSNVLCAQIRRGEISKDEARRIYLQDPFGADAAKEYFIKRLGISNAEYENVMKEDPRSWTEFQTYKRVFENLRPVFRFLLNRRRITQSFYLKYCEKGQIL